MKFAIYDTLPKESMNIRNTVFVEEQGFIDEFDDIDKISSHILLFDGNSAIATCRVFSGDAPGEYHIGRLAVIREYRGRGLGRKIIEEAERHILSLGGESASLHSQLQAKSFYEKCGYEPYGEIEYEQDCPHIGMRKKLK